MFFNKVKLNGHFVSNNTKTPSGPGALRRFFSKKGKVSPFHLKLKILHGREGGSSGSFEWGRVSMFLKPVSY